MKTHSEWYCPNFGQGMYSKNVPICLPRAPT